MFGLDKQSRLNKKLITAVKAGEVKEARDAIEAGADINTRDRRYWDMPPLGVAAHKGNMFMLKMLLDKGADLNAPDSDGETPLMNAVNNSHADAIAELLKRGADKNLANNKGLTAIDKALEKNKTSVFKVLGIGVSVKKPEAAADAAPEKKTAPKKQPAPERQENTEEVVFFRQLGNRILEENFNFAARERITLLRKDMDGPVEAMTREAFDAIGDKASLRYAFELYKAKGGKRPESDVFPDALGKPMTFPGRQP